MCTGERVDAVDLDETQVVQNTVEVGTVARPRPRSQQQVMGQKQATCALIVQDWSCHAALYRRRCADNSMSLSRRHATALNVGWMVRLGPVVEAPRFLDFHAFRDRQSVLEFDPGIADSAVHLGVPEQELDCPQFASLPVDMCDFGQPHGMRAAGGWVQPDGTQPVPNELLNRELFHSLREAQIIIEGWRKHYNTKRPHCALGYRPPAPEAFVMMEPRPIMH